MKKLIKYAVFFVLIVILSIIYISYRNSIPLKDLPEVLSTITSPPMDEKYLDTYTTPAQKILDVLHYDINIDLFPADKIIKGDVIIKMVTKGLDKIDLNFYDNFKITKTLLNGKSVKYENKDTRFTILPEGKLGDTSLVEIAYEGKPKKAGFGSFNFEEKEGKPFIYTMNEPVYASTWFPCNDVPSDKALVDIKISNDSSDVSVSNGILVSVNKNGARKIYHWKTVYPIATYLVAFYSAAYHSFNDEYISSSKIKMPITYYVMPENLESAKSDFHIHAQAIGIYSKLFGEYPFIKEKYGIAEFLWNKGALENQTITGLGSQFISGQGFYKDLLLHELAHSWWGNAVTISDWKDIWLNEGFATYPVALYYEALSDKRALFSTMRGSSGDFEKGTLYNPSDEVFGKLIYDKGAWVLHMLRKEIGDDLFFKIIKKYYADYKYKNTTTKEFETVCESVSKKNLEYFFNQWVFKGTGIINAEVKTSVSKLDKGKYSVKVDIIQTQNGYPVYNFPLDINFTSENKENSVKTIYINKKSSQFELILDFNPANFEPDPDGWLLAKFSKK